MAKNSNYLLFNCLHMLMFDFLWMTCNKSYETWVRFPQLAQLRRPELKSLPAGAAYIRVFHFLSSH